MSGDGSFFPILFSIEVFIRTVTATSEGLSERAREMDEKEMRFRVVVVLTGSGGLTRSFFTSVADRGSRGKQQFPHQRLGTFAIRQKRRQIRLRGGLAAAVGCNEITRRSISSRRQTYVRTQSARSFERYFSACPIHDSHHLSLSFSFPASQLTDDERCFPVVVEEEETK